MSDSELDRLEALEFDDSDDKVLGELHAPNSQELAECPFCGQTPRNIVRTHLSYPLAHCTNQDCVGSWMTVGAGGNKYHWNTRPLEDELRAEAASGERWADEYHRQAQALQAQVDKLKEVVEMVVAYGEIWKAKGYILPSEFEFVLFDAALHALEGGE